MKFVVLRCLETRTAEKVARKLVDIFCGPPETFQSLIAEESREITRHRLEIRCGKPQRRGHVERRTAGVFKRADGKQRLDSILKRREMKRSPFEALFGKKTVSPFAFTASIFKPAPSDTTAENDVKPSR